MDIQIEYLFHFNALFVIFEKEKDCLKIILLAHKVLSHFRFWCQICVLFFINENSIFFCSILFSLFVCLFIGCTFRICINICQTEDPSISRSHSYRLFKLRVIDSKATKRGRMQTILCGRTSHTQNMYVCKLSELYNSLGLCRYAKFGSIQLNMYYVYYLYLYMYI